MDEAHDYRFGPVLEPEPGEQEPAGEIAVAELPVQEDIVVAAETETSIKPQLRAEVRAKRDAMSDRERNAGARRIVERLLHHPTCIAPRRYCCTPTTAPRLPPTIWPRS